MASGFPRAEADSGSSSSPLPRSSSESTDTTDHGRSDARTESPQTKMSEVDRLKELENAAEKIRRNEWEAIPNPKVTTKSVVWEIFHVVRETEARKILNFAQCQRCGIVKSYVFGGATSSLKRHHVKCTGKAPVDFTGVTLQMKTQFKNALIDLCVGDIRPFSLVEGSNFSNLIQTAIDLGAEHGHLNAKDLIPCASTISRGVQVKAEEARILVKPKILEALRGGNISFTTDMWVEELNKYHFLTLTSHLINDDWELENRILFTSEFPYESATASNILSELITNLEKFEITENDLERVCFVTDGGANIVKALKNLRRLYCAAHNLNVISTHIFSIKLPEVDLLDSVGSLLVSNVESLIIFLNDKKLNKTLSEAIPLIQDKGTGRYKSKVPMLQLLYNEYKEVHELLEEIGETERLTSISKSNLYDLMCTLKEVERVAAGNALHGSDFPWLEEFCKPKTLDSQFLAELRAHLRKELAITEALFEIENCKSLVTYAKRSGVNSHLEERLKNPPDTRWNSKCPMFRSVIAHIERTASNIAEVENDDDVNIAPLSGPHARLQELSQKINPKIVQSLLNFAEPFEKETDRMQGESYPTLQFVALSYCRLLKYCEPQAGDDILMARLKERGQEELKNRMKLHDFHKISTFLWPNFRNLKMFDSEERNRIWDLARTMCEAMELEQPQNFAEPPAKKSRPVDDNDDYADWCEESSSNELFDDDVTRYIKDRCSNVVVSELLSFWGKGQGCQYPRLQALVRRILTIPATSAPSERVFSLAGHTYSKRRANLDPNTVDDCLFYFDFLQNKK